MNDHRGPDGVSAPPDRPDDDRPPSGRTPGAAPGPGRSAPNDLGAGWVGQDRAGPAEPGQDRAGPAEPGQDRAGRDGTGPVPGTPAWGTPQPGFPPPVPPPEAPIEAPIETPIETPAGVTGQAPAAGGPPLPQQRDGGRHRSGWGKAAGVGAGAAALAGKAGLLAKGLLLLKGLAVLGKLKVLGSMLISVVVYALFWGWQFALGFVILLAVHELGHVVALRAQGVEASAPMFIPLVGAFVAVRGRQRSVVDEAWMALAGPAAGLAGSIACLELAELNESLLLRAIAYSGFLLNLFNLVPVLPLDGGRVAGALHPAIWFGGIGIAVALFVWRPSPVLGFVFVLGGIEAIQRWREHRRGEAGSYYRGEAGSYYTVPAAARGQIAGAYVTVALICMWGMHAAYVAHPI